MSKYKNHMTINKSLQDKDKDWWLIRKSLMNKWICKPDWCCLQIRRYLGRLQYSDKIKIQTVSFYLSLSGFRPGAINYPCVIRLKQDVFNEVKNRKNKGNWH
ncbi:MAG: hypothetical protein DRI84_02815 [Bacteroidetes bacterium]|nr:MAG: hypothetical protein DRI84_02815 [Bacteroidota bacterium]